MKATQTAQEQGQEAYKMRHFSNPYEYSIYVELKEAWEQGYEEARICKEKQSQVERITRRAYMNERIATMKQEDDDATNVRW